MKNNTSSPLDSTLSIIENMEQQGDLNVGMTLDNYLNHVAIAHDLVKQDIIRNGSDEEKIQLFNTLRIKYHSHYNRLKQRA